MGDRIPTVAVGKGLSATPPRDESLRRRRNVRAHQFGSKTWYLNASLLLPFEELESLYLSDNYLGGWIAPEEPNLPSSRLRKLEVLDLSLNSG
ncbi:hypothetical protein NL676_033113 [Syzygium grande]|nr:hypothetical protein NL676_033113 [Syzygium grande]